MNYLSMMVLLGAVLLGIVLWVLRRMVKLELQDRPFTVAVLHPACNAGGGGEKVLWALLMATARTLHGQGIKHDIVIYSGEKDVLQEDMVATAESKFNLEGLSKAVGEVRVIFVGDKAVLAPGRVLTVLVQIVQQVRYGWWCLMKQPAHLVIDTQGFPFAYPVFKILGGAKVMSYTHYPFISRDMIDQVWSRTPGYSNSALVRGSYVLTAAKVLYYHLLMLFYRTVGWSVDLVLANSSWTLGHMRNTWSVPTRLVFPPCNIDAFTQLSLETTRQPILMSFSQFRPEKRQRMQLDVLKRLKEGGKAKELRMVMVGSVRGAQDEALLKGLQDYATKIGVQDMVEFRTNQSFSELVSLMGSALVAVHTMKKEHFGISVVELMAAGVITIAHNSAGPKQDIIGHDSPQAGYLADSEEDYALAVEMVLASHRGEGSLNRRVRRAAREKVGRFGHGAFEEGVEHGLREVMGQEE